MEFTTQMKNVQPETRQRENENELLSTAWTPADCDLVATMSHEDIDGYVHYVHSVELSGKQEMQLQKSMRLLKDYLATLKGVEQFTQCFAKHDTLGTHAVERAVFLGVLRDKAHMTERDITTILAKLLPSTEDEEAGAVAAPSEEKVNYINFFNIVKAYVQQRKTGRNLSSEN